MNRELYFIPIIARAFEERDTSRALSDAMARILELSRDRAYAQGYSQFTRFMDDVSRRWAEGWKEAMEAEAARAMIVALGTETLEGGEAERQAARRMIDARPSWRDELRRFETETRVTDEVGTALRFLLKRGDDVLGHVICEVPGRRRFAAEIVPGHYELVLDSGLLLWERHLRARELLWSLAFPGQELDLAADTGESQLQPAVEDTALGGELILRAFPGLESGRLEVEVR